MQGLYLLSNAWGAESGGINVFNTDFAIALGEAIGERITVGCIVLTADDEDVAEAQSHGVQLLHIGKSPGHDTFDPARAHEIKARLLQENLPVDQCVWVGNDIITGDIALNMSAAVQSPWVVLIHHMSYIDYQGYKHGVGVEAENKYRRQRELFERADQVFGVGPMLRDRLCDMLSSDQLEPGMIVPGLLPIEPRRTPTTFTVSTFGRLDPENDRIKQGRLAVAGFAEMVRRSDEAAMRSFLSSRPPILRLIGIGQSGGDEENELRNFAYRHAGRAVNLHPLPYDDNRQRLLKDLAGSSAAMMLSWHEGFGLTGWEAIAAEVPLIIGENSGLYQLIKEKLGPSGLGCLHPIQIYGGVGVAVDGQNTQSNFTTEDVDSVCNALINILIDSKAARRGAAELKSDLLEKGCSWRGAAIQFARDLGLKSVDMKGNQLIIGTEYRKAKGGEAERRSGGDEVVGAADLSVRPTSNEFAERHLTTRSAFILACTESLRSAQTIRATLVGPLLVHPKWYSDRRQPHRLYPNFDLALREKIMELRQNATLLDDVRLIFRNSKRYTDKIDSVVFESEREKFKQDVLSGIDEIWGEDGQRGPRICCVDTGNLRVEVIYDDCILSSVRPRSGDPIEGGNLVRSRSSAKNERSTFDQLFEANYSGQHHEVMRLKNFISSLWEK